jgi:hypothetical protein
MTDDARKDAIKRSTARNRGAAAAPAGLYVLLVFDGFVLLGGRMGDPRGERCLP